MNVAATYLALGIAWWAWCVYPLLVTFDRGDAAAALRAVPHVLVLWPLDFSIIVARKLASTRRDP
jgi:hypothetical protein